MGLSCNLTVKQVNFSLYCLVFVWFGPKYYYFSFLPHPNHCVLLAMDTVSTEAMASLTAVMVDTVATVMEGERLRLPLLLRLMQRLVLYTVAMEAMEIPTVDMEAMERGRLKLAMGS